VRHALPANPGTEGIMRAGVVWPLIQLKSDAARGVLICLNAVGASGPSW